MGFLGNLSGMLQQYAGGGAAPAPGEAEEHFAQAAAQAPQPALAGALEKIFASPQTGTFGQNISSLFNQSAPDQRAGILNRLAQYATPGMLSQLGLGGLGGAVPAGAAPQMAPQMTAQITAEQAQRVDPQAVEQLANHAQQQNPGIVQEASQFYAQHPTLVKALGGAAAILALRHFAESYS